MIFDLNQPFVDKAQRLTSWGHWFTFFNILLALVISYSYISTDELPHNALGLAYLISNWLGHTAFLTFVCFLLTIFPLSMIFPYPRHIRGMAAIIASVGMVFLAIDAYSYSRLGYHFSGASLEQVFTLLMQTWQDHPLRSFMWVFGISTIILSFELWISNFTWQRVGQLKRLALGQKFALFFLTAFVSSHIIHIVADVNFDYEVTKQNNMFPFSYPATAKTLLAKNGLLDKQAFDNQQANQLSVKNNLDYFVSPQKLQCDVAQIDDLQILLTTDPIDAASSQGLVAQGMNLFSKHYVPSNPQDAVFNLLYGLPAVYKNSIIAHQQQPLWYELARRHQLGVEIDASNSAQLAGYDFITPVTAHNNKTITIRQIDNNRLATYLQGLSASNIIIIGQAMVSDSAISKTELFVKWHKPIRYRGQVSQNIDINPTLIQSWLNCQPTGDVGHSQELDVFGKNLLHKRPKRLAANYSNGTIIAIHKDKITLLNEQGHSQRISATNGYILSQETDIPTLNDTIKLLKKYSHRQLQP